MMDGAAEIICRWTRAKGPSEQAKIKSPVEMITASEEYREAWRLYSQFKEERKVAMANVNSATCPDWWVKGVSGAEDERVDGADEVDDNVMSVVEEGSEKDDEDGGILLEPPEPVSPREIEEYDSIQ